MTTQAVSATNLDLPNRRQGKVRDIYDLPGIIEDGPALVIIASDRLSAFDVVLPDPLPGKGVILNQLSAAWLGWIESSGLARTHLLTAEPGEVAEILSRVGVDAADARKLAPRSMIVRTCEILPVECVARGYLEGSGWAEYQSHGSVCGIALPDGLERGGRLPEPIFTPATKADAGDHDENISFEEACAAVGERAMHEARALTLRIYDAACAYALNRGIILADTKFEFGRPVGSSGDGGLILADEALTPDSSRYWPREGWAPGGAQPSFDKQFVRNHLQSLTDRGAWNKQAPGPALPSEVIEGTLERYRAAAEALFPGVLDGVTGTG